MGKTTRPFRYDLNQTPYDYTVQVTTRFKELDLIDGVSEELWLEVHDIEWLALETNRDHFVVFETTSKYSILDSC